MEEVTEVQEEGLPGGVVAVRDQVPVHRVEAVRDRGAEEAARAAGVAAVAVAPTVFLPLRGPDVVGRGQEEKQQSPQTHQDLLVLPSHL